MTSDEIALLVQSGSDTYLNVATFVSTFVLYGGYLLALTIVMRLLLFNTARRKLQVISVGCTIFAASILTLNYVGCLMTNLVDIYYGYIKTLPQGLPAQAESANTHMILMDEITVWIINILILMSDCTAMWRACIMWPNSRLLKVTLIILTVGNFVVQICDGIFPEFSNGAITGWDVASASFSLGINLTTTAIIGLKAWQYQKDQSNMGLKHHGLNKSQQVLLFWIESGVIFCATQALWAVFDILDLNQTSTNEISVVNFAENITSQIVTAGGALYPIAVFIIVSQGMSVVEEMSFQSTYAAGQQENTPNDSHDPTMALDHLVGATQDSGVTV